MSQASDQTRARIQRVAAELFAGRGFDGTSVREIVQAAGVTQPMLYYYFGSKDGLGGEILRQAHRTFQETLDRSGGGDRGDPIEQLAALLRAHCDFVRDNPSETRFFYAVILGLGGKPRGVDVEAIRNDCIGRVRARIEGIARQGLLDSGVTDNVLMIVLGMINGYTVTKLDGWRELPDDQELRTTVGLLWRGMGRTAGRAGPLRKEDR